MLQETKSHPTADGIYNRLKEEVPGLSLGTVYRNLRVLTEQGHIQKLPFGSSFDRYDANTAPHYHLVCETCGVVADFEIPQYAAINEMAGKQSKFRISGHRIDFFGICENCWTKNQPPTKRKGK